MPTLLCVKATPLSGYNTPAEIPEYETSVSLGTLAVIRSFAFSHLLLCTELELTRTKTIEQHAWFGLHHLISLRMSYFGLKVLKANSFNHLNSLETLTITGEELEVIAGKAFLGLESLTDLQLSGNNIRSIEKNAWLGLSSLNNLALETDMFLNLPRLRILDLSEQKPDTAEKNSIFNGLLSLVELRLRLTFMIAIERDTWDWIGLSSVRTLDLSYNKLQGITKDTFLHLSSLILLNVATNEITQVGEKAFEPLSLLEI